MSEREKKKTESGTERATHDTRPAQERWALTACLCADGRGHQTGGERPNHRVLAPGEGVVRRVERRGGIRVGEPRPERREDARPDAFWVSETDSTQIEKYHYFTSATPRSRRP